MQEVRALHRLLLGAGLLLGLLAVLPGPSRAAGDDDPLEAQRKAAEFEKKRKKAQEALKQREEERRLNGWKPKSRDEQMVTKLSRYEDYWTRKQELAMTRSTFEAARGEVYHNMARYYASIGYYRRAYVYTYVQDRVTGLVRPVRTNYDYWVLDPWAARLSAHFANRAARSKGIAAAQEYHANTYYERQVRNTGSRIAELQKKITLQTQLAGKLP